MKKIVLFVFKVFSIHKSNGVSKDFVKFPSIIYNLINVKIETVPAEEDLVQFYYTVQIDTYIYIHLQLRLNICGQKQKMKKSLKRKNVLRVGVTNRLSRMFSCFHVNFNWRLSKKTKKITDINLLLFDWNFICLMCR